MTKTILNLETAVNACGLFAGKIMASPIFTLLSYGNHTFATTVFATKADEAQAK